MTPPPAAPDRILVLLDFEELHTAANTGVRRHIDALKRKRQDAHGASAKDGWQYHIQGAAGELAFAKFVNRYWNGTIGRVDTNDVGRYEVRTRSMDDYELNVYKEDPDRAKFVLVTGLAPRLYIRGWLWGCECKREEWWRSLPGSNRPPAYWVPQAALHSTREKLPYPLTVETTEEQSA